MKIKTPTPTQSQTIWESASRPLFVRSVWIDTSNEGRGALHRHFILDYEAHEPIDERRKSTRLAVSPTRIDRRESFYQPESYDISELSTSFDSEESIDNLLLVGSAKIKLQEQPSQNFNKQQLRLLRFHRRPSFTKQPKRQKTDTDYAYQLNRRMRELQELYSKHSSSQDMQSTLSNACSNPEERLAERVLNWLDMAGKSDVMKKNIENDMSNDKYSKVKEPFAERNRRLQPQRRQQQQQQEQQTSNQCANLATIRARRKANSSSRITNQQSNNRNQQTDGVKPITIIFSRDGFPVRLNRPARNIDLCTMASNGVTTRRLAGSLASARLYKDTEAVAYKPSRTVRNGTAKSITKPTITTRSVHTASMRFAETDKGGPGGNFTQKRMHDDLSSGHIQDSKRQLHIFMPSLPKKGINSPSMLSGNYGTNADDTSVSILSRSFNENCKL